MAVIDTASEDVRARIKELTAGRGADVIFDPIGGDIFQASLRSIAWGGRILVIGFASSQIRRSRRTSCWSRTRPRSASTGAATGSTTWRACAPRSRSCCAGTPRDGSDHSSPRCDRSRRRRRPWSAFSRARAAVRSCSPSTIRPEEAAMAGRMTVVQGTSPSRRSTRSSMPPTRRCAAAAAWTARFTGRQGVS